MRASSSAAEAAPAAPAVVSCTAAETDLPDEIDTDRDADALERLGLDRTQLMAKLAGGGLGGTLAP